MTVAHSLSISLRISHWRENSRTGERIDLYQCCWSRAEVPFRVSGEKDFGQQSKFQGQFALLLKTAGLSDRVEEDARIRKRQNERSL